MDSLLSVCDIKDDVEYILDLASKIKSGDIEEKPLEGKTLAMIFQKSSTRTRVSFDVGMYQLGGRAIFLSSNDLQMGRGEPISDTAKVLSRFVDGIMIRAIEHCDVEELAKYSDVPVISGLTNLEHPCQALADMLTIKEHFGTFDDKKICFVGDGNNVCNSLLLIAPLLGMDMSVACPKGYEPNEDILKTAQEFAGENNTEIIVSDDIGVALENVEREDTNLGAAFLVMAIVGGALMPPLQGAVIDCGELFGMPAVNLSFVLPLLCFVAVTLYGYRCSWNK